MLSKFFMPDDEMSKFIVTLSENKTIVDIGCGTGHVLNKLRQNGCNNFIGFEPFTPFNYFEHKVAHRIIPRQVNDEFTFNMLSKIADKCIVILCRPCHHVDLILGTFLLCKLYKIPMYYIGLERNIKNDLDINAISYDRIEHQGTSAENEIILKINF